MFLFFFYIFKFKSYGKLRMKSVSYLDYLEYLDYGLCTGPAEVQTQISQNSFFRDSKL